MKFLIGESKIKKLVYNYLDSLPELKDLEITYENFFDWDQGVSVDAVFFEQISGIPIMTYYPEQSQKEGWETIDLESHPLLIISTDIPITKFLNEKHEDLIKEWFEEKFNLPVKTLLFN